MDIHHYRVFGLSVGSTILLPDLSPIEPETTVDVSIAAGSVPHRLIEEPVGLRVTANGAILNIPEAGRYIIADGRTIIAEPSPQASNRAVRLYLLGSAFGAVLHQRGLLPLHANVIGFDGSAIAFMGRSGAGKSTLANWFHDRGRAVLGDDVCVVRYGHDGVPLAEPGIPRVRLWGDALAASGRVAADYRASFDDVDKYDVPIASIVQQPLPLAAIYTLAATGTDEIGSIRRLTGIGAIEALMTNTYRGGYLPLLGGVERHMAQCVQLARHVPVYALRRQWGLADFAQQIRAVESHIETVIAEARTQRSVPSAWDHTAG